MINKPIDRINAEDIQQLVDNKTQESMTLEYKSELPSNNDSSTKKFLAEVSAFANKNGGLIIYGISEKLDEEGNHKGNPKEICGCGEININTEKLRLDGKIRDGLSPRLQNYQIKDLNVNEKTVIIIRIQRSLLMPHMIRFNQSGKFYSRNSGGKYQMDADELRQAYLQSDEWVNKTRQFRLSRFNKVTKLEFLENLNVNQGLLLHIVPLGNREGAFDLLKSKSTFDMNTELPHRLLNPEVRFNLDGYFVGERKNPKFYIQYFRDGSMEVYTSKIKLRPENRKFELISGYTVEDYVNKCTFHYFKIAADLEIQPPFVIFLTLFGLKGIALGCLKGSLIDEDDLEPIKFDRNELFIPELIIDEIPSDATTLLQPIMDIFWQSAGYEESPLKNKKVDRNFYY